MFLLTKPTESEISDFLNKRVDDNFSYPEIGATLSEIPPNYTVDHNRIKLGNDGADFECAKNAVHHWKMFDIGWVELSRADTPIEVGRNVAILVNHLGFWSLNAARIVYTIDEPKRFGFAYGTLTEHGEIGEERFTVELDEYTGDVWYDLLAFSRPASLLAKLGYPIARHFQKKFATDSKSAMLRALETAI